MAYSFIHDVCRYIAWFVDKCSKSKHLMNMLHFVQQHACCFASTITKRYMTFSRLNLIFTTLMAYQLRTNIKPTKRHFKGYVYISSKSKHIGPMAVMYSFFTNITAHRPFLGEQVKCKHNSLVSHSKHFNTIPSEKAAHIQIMVARSAGHGPHQRPTGLLERFSLIQPSK